MAQRQIPGSVYVNESGAAQFQVPGGAYLNETVNNAVSIACGIGAAVAAGLTCTIESVTPPAPVDTGKRGIPPFRRPRTYYVRVGDRMYRVNPDDPRTLRTLYAATQAEAERVAAQEAEQAVQATEAPQDAPEPEEVAQAVVRAEPVRAEPSVDLAALQAEIDAISAKVREVFAAAFQRELIARLMQERMAREDDDAAAMLLLMD